MSNMSSLETQLPLIIQNLLEATSDKDEKVRNALYLSLQKIGRYYPTEVITLAINFRQRNPKLNNNGVRCIYNLIRIVCENELQLIDLKLVHKIIESACDESLKSAEAPYISADVLPVVGTKYCDEVYEYISKYMQEGVAPHASIIFILGQLSISNMKVFFRISKDIFKYLLSILPVTKTDNMRKTYAATISQMVESIIEQTSAEETSVVKESYSVIVEEIFEIFVTSWLQIKDVKICETIIQAAGSLVLLFSDQKLMNDTPRIVSTFLGMYKKSSSIPRFVITQAISNFLSVVPRSALQSSLDAILNALHVMVWVLPDFTQPLTVKNHSEVLRCYDYLGSLFEDKLYEVLLRNLRSNSEQDRVVSLIVTSHLLNSSEKLLRSQISEIMSVLRSLLDDSSYRINRGLVKIIIALAYRECLAEKDAVFIEFLVKHCHHNTTNPDLDDLESMCKSTVNLFSTTISSVQPLCWKVLLHMLMNGDNFGAVSTFAKSLAHLVLNCDHAILEKNCYERSETVFVRVTSLLGSPLHENRGIYLLNFLQDYVLWKVKVEPVIWKMKITHLLMYLESSEWEEFEWEVQLLEALSASFIEDTKPWLGAVNSEILKLLSHYQSNNELFQATNANTITLDERAFLYKLLALLTNYIDDENVINTNVEKILFPVCQRSLIDHKACSRSVGILSKTHFNLVYKQLEYHQKTLLIRKTNKFLSFLKDNKNEAEIEIVRRIICDCYTEILTDTPSIMLLPKLKELLSWLINVMQATKDFQTKHSCSEALYRMAEIILKSENEFEGIEECKNGLMIFLSNLIEGEKCMPMVFCLKTVNVLFKLSVSTNASEKLLLVQKCLNKLFQYYSVSSNTSAITETGVINLDPVIQQLSFAMSETVKNANSSILDKLVNFLQPWISHRIINHRIISMYLLKSVLVCYVDCYFNDVKNSNKLDNISSLLGRVYVRTYELNEELSSLASDCVCLLLIINEAYTDNANISADEIRKNVSTLKSSNMEVFRVTTYCKLSPEQLLHFVEILIAGLLDCEISCSLGTARILQAIFSEVGVQFQRQALDIFNSMLLKLTKLESEETQPVVIGAVIALAHHHKDMFVNTMLNQSLPFHPAICKCWNELGRDTKFTHEILKRLLEAIMYNPIFESNSKNTKNSVVDCRPIVAVAALKELLISFETVEIVKMYFPDLFCSILMLIPCYMGQKMSTNDKAVKESVLSSEPARVAFDTLSVVMEQADFKNVRENFTPFANKIDFKKSEKTSAYYEMVKELAKIMSYSNCDFIVKVLVSLSAYIDQSHFDGQRGTVTVFYVEIFNSKCSEDGVLVDTIITSLLSLLNDPSALVREHCIMGLASISNLEFSLVERYKERILSALVQGLDDNEASTYPGIVIQSLLGVSKLLPFLNDDCYTSILVSLTIRIKQFFEKDDVEIRRSSLKLFGELVQSSNVNSSSFSEQVLRNLVCLFLHLGEKEVSIVQTCKFSLKAVSHLVKSEKLGAMINKHLIDDGNLNYQGYISKIAEVMAKELPEYTYDYLMIAISYTKSIWSEIRASAAIFIGIMYLYQNEKFRSQISVETVSGKLLILLRDQDSHVRACAALAMGSLLNSSDPALNESVIE